jgi:shikimate dehydrogenase
MIRLGLVGYPLGHSLSPKIHALALQSAGLQGDYSLFPVPPGDLQALKDLLARVRGGEIAGLNVTIPHKQTIIPLLDELAYTARVIGAVNTVSIQNNRLTGENTDALGFLRDLRQAFGNSGQEKSALVLGAGGSARAVVYALLNDGWEISITARRPEQVHSLIAQFSNRDSRLLSVEYHSGALHALLPTLSLLVNTTPVGMSPHINASPWPAGLPLPCKAAVYDLVYDPEETKLVKDARAAGLPASTGLGMLIEQAALAFEIWTGVSVQRKSLLAALEET